MNVPVHWGISVYPDPQADTVLRGGCCDGKARAGGAQRRSLDPADGRSRGEAMLVLKHPGWVNLFPGEGGVGTRLRQEY